MFKYNILSDLKDGSLVTPVRKHPKGIVCIDENGLEILKVITDFDFAKKVEDRDSIDETLSLMENDLSDEEEVNDEVIVVSKVVEKVIYIEKEKENVKPAPKSSLETIIKENRKINIETQYIRGNRNEG